MAGEMTTPLLPCASIEEIIGFYEALGFRTTYRQRRPTGYAVVAREDLALHFFAMDGFVARDSYGSCLIGVPDAGALYEDWRARLRGYLGAVPVAGIPRLTRPRKRRGRVAGFALIDPGGNWLRVYEQSGEAAAPDDADQREPGAGALATALQAAGALGDSKGDLPGAARVVDAALARATAAPVADLAAALVYRAELALGLGDRAGATAFLDRLAGLALDAAARAAAADDLGRADDLRRSLAADA